MIHLAIDPISLLRSGADVEALAVLVALLDIEPLQAAGVDDVVGEPVALRLVPEADAFATGIVEDGPRDLVIVGAIQAQQDVTAGDLQVSEEPPVGLLQLERRVAIRPIDDGVLTGRAAQGDGVIVFAAGLDGQSVVQRIVPPDRQRTSLGFVWSSAFWRSSEVERVCVHSTFDVSGGIVGGAGRVVLEPFVGVPLSTVTVSEHPDKTAESRSSGIKLCVHARSNRIRTVCASTNHLSIP